MDKPNILIEPSTYIGINKIEKLLEILEKFIENDISRFCIDVGEMNVRFSINWKSLILFDKTNNFKIDPDLEKIAADVVEYSNTIEGLNRITINFLMRYSFMAMHTDTPSKDDYDTSGTMYNMILPINDNGWSIVDYKVIKNKKGHPLIFDGQIPHGAMNDTPEIRKTVYLLIDKNYFK